ncbi:MAG: DUF4388 domain-containing protein [Oligoflexus sp.]
MKEKISVRPLGGGVNISGLTGIEGEQWIAKPISRSRVILKQNDRELSGDEEGFAYFRLDVFISTLFGFVKRKFSGVVSVDNGNHIKKLYFKEGRLVFASSNLIDDRLGEVIYRAGMITLEQMTEAAVQVNRTTKFGKVLIDSQQFTSADLWDALKLQVSSIFQSVFFTDYVYYQIQSGTVMAPTTVIFEEPMEALIEDVASFGQMFRSFVARLQKESEVKLMIKSSAKQEGGTFLDDMVDMIRQSPIVENIVNQSKLTPFNTYSAILDLINSRVAEVSHLKESASSTPESAIEVRELKSLIDAYHVLLSASKRAFEVEKVPFPTTELHIFLERKYRAHRSPLFLQNDGVLAAESVRSLYARSRNSRLQQKIMLGHLQSLIQFLLQVTGDLLPEKGWKFKKSFQEMLLT